jgi:flagellar biosynthesis/type III secretory pathway M-ring protein FliF/YscJ
VIESDADKQSPDETLEYRFEQLKKRFTSAIQPILGASSQQWLVRDLEIEVIDIPSNARSDNKSTPDLWVTWDRLLPFLALGLAVALGTLLLVQRRVEPEFRRSEPASAAGRQGESVAQRATRSRVGEIPDEMRHKLQKLVQDDPDRAAEVFKKWIRDAA